MSRILSFAGVIAITLTAVSTNAQTSLKYLSYADAKNYASAKYAVNAMKNFEAVYGEDTKENWSEKADGFRASFRKDGVLYLVDYNKKGKPLSTIRIYNEKLLPKDVRRMIKTTFYDFDIVSIAEVSIQHQMIYLIKIQDETSLKTLRILDNEMDVVADFHRADH